MAMQRAACVARIDAEYWQIIGLVSYALVGFGWLMPQAL
jgi:hypothetical protein